MAAYMISGDGNISIVLGGTQYNVVKGASNYDAVLEGIKNKISDEDLVGLVSPVKKVIDYLFDDDIKVEAGVIFYKGKEIHTNLTDRIIKFMTDGLPVDPLFNFLKKVMANPSFSARKELYDFLEHKSLPITEDGDFLAYKAVNNNYTDKHTGVVSNAIGTELSMDRYDVDDDRNNGCSSGYHAGTLEYVNSYGRFSDDKETTDKCVIVKINPSDVVSVPLDCNCQKLRTCKYFVLKDYEGEMVKALYQDDGSDYNDDNHCVDCGNVYDDCTCEDECSVCGEYIEDCTCE